MYHCEVKPALTSTMRLEDIQDLDDKALQKFRMNLTCPI